MVLHFHLTGPQIFNKYPAFYELKMFMTAFTKARHFFPILSQINTVHAFIFSVNNICFNIIIPSTSIFSRVLPTKPVRVYLLITHSASHKPRPSHYVLSSTIHEASHYTILSSPCYVFLFTNITYMDLGVNKWVAPWFLWLPIRLTIGYYSA